MPVRPPAAMASRSTAGNQKRRRKRRRSGAGRAYARLFASSLRVCLADIEKEPSLEKREVWGTVTPENFKAHPAELFKVSPPPRNYNLREASGARRTGGRDGVALLRAGGGIYNPARASKWVHVTDGGERSRQGPGSSDGCMPGVLCGPLTSVEKTTANSNELALAA